MCSISTVSVHCTRATLLNLHFSTGAALFLIGAWRVSRVDDDSSSSRSFAYEHESRCAHWTPHGCVCGAQRAVKRTHSFGGAPDALSAEGVEFKAHQLEADAGAWRSEIESNWRRPAAIDRRGNRACSGGDNFSCRGSDL